MVLPLIPLALIGVGAVSGASGAALGFKGGLDLKNARGSVREAVERYTAERASLEELEGRTNTAVEGLGEWQARAFGLVVERFAGFLRRNQKLVTESERILLDGLDATVGMVTLDGGLDQDSVDWIKGIAGSAAVGAAINAGVPTAVTALATASTGTAISTLSGVAATNATYAALGGGSIAAGGGGMAAGVLALNFVTIGPAIFASGLLVAGQGEKAKTKARANKAEVAAAIAEMQITRVEFESVIARAAEMVSILESIVERAEVALDELEAVDFDPRLHANQFQKALHLTLGVRDMASTALIDDEGHLNEGTATFAIKYKAWTKESDS